MKKLFGILLASITCLAACDNSNNSSSSVKLDREYPSSVETNLIEGVDYIDHATTYDGKKFEYNEDMWYINELKDVPLPDPHVFYEDGLYYITGTSDRSNGKVVDCYVTEDFNNYSLIELYDPADYKGWESSTNPQIYAPEIYEFDGSYYMYYSAMDKSKTPIRRNSVVVADNPAGPYEPIQEGSIDGLNNPLFNYESKNSLDITVFQDDNGELYMYYSTTQGAISPVSQIIVGVKLKSPYEADWSTYKTLVIPGSKTLTGKSGELFWETFRAGQIVEAPYMIKSKGKYYLTYSVNGCFNKYYSVCYAVSSSPLGDFEKPYVKDKIWTNLLFGYGGLQFEDNTVYQQWGGFASGTGHHCFFKSGDQLMIGYHAHQNRDFNKDSGAYTKRYFAFDYLYFDKDGVPFCNGPTNSIQPLPEEISGYKNIAPTAEVNRNNVTNENCVNDNYIVDNYNLEDGSKEVVLGKGKSYIELEFDKEYTIGGIAIYNSAYYDEAVYEIEYIDFMNGNALYYPEFCKEAYVNDEKNFIFPVSAFTMEFPETFKSSKVVICFNTENGGRINEIKVLGV